MQRCQSCPAALATEERAAKLWQTRTSSSESGLRPPMSWVAPFLNRMILKMAICLLDNLEDPYSDRPRKVMFTVDELYFVPGRWELWKG